MPVTILVVVIGLAVIVVTVYAAAGRCGEMPAERSDYAPLDLGPVSATDVALFRPSSAMWGYDVRVTDEALGRIATSIRDRDVRIVALEQLVTDLSRVNDSVPPESGPLPRARHRRDSGASPSQPVPGASQPVPGAEAPLPPPVPGTQVPLAPPVPEPPAVPRIPAVSSISDTIAAAPTAAPAGEPAPGAGEPAPGAGEPASADDQPEQEDEVDD